MNIYNVVVATQLWAKNKSIINKCYLYGSRISGQNSSDSDLDVAILINYKGSKEEELKTFYRESNRLNKDLTDSLSVAVDLRLYNKAIRIPKVANYFNKTSVMIYDEDKLLLWLRFKALIRIKQIQRKKIPRYKKSKD